MAQTTAEKIKTNRSFYLTDETRKLIRKVTNLINIEDESYTQDDAMLEAFKLLEEKRGLNQTA